MSSTTKYGKQNKNKQDNKENYERELAEAQKRYEAAKKEFGNFETVLTNTRNRLRQADEELDKLIGTRTRAINRKLKTVSVLDSSEESDKVLELI